MLEDALRTNGKNGYMAGYTETPFGVSLDARRVIFSHSVSQFCA